MSIQSKHSSQRDLWRRPSEYLLYALLLAGVFLGGAPSAANWQMLAIAAIASILVPVSIAGGALGRFRTMPVLVRLGVLLVPLIPLMQLLPLPPNIYKTLPGRELAMQVSDLLGTGSDWRPLSLVPRQTLLAFALILPAAATWLAALLLDKNGRRRAVLVLLVAASISIFVGVVQFGTKGSALDIYETAHRGSFLGFFANRNHQGLFMGIAGVLAISAAKYHIKDPRMAMAISALLAMVCLIAAIGTLSRAGIGLTMLGLVAIGVALFLRRSPGWPALVSTGAVALPGFYFLGFSTTVQQALDRFSQVEENGRWDIWQKTAPLIEQYLPWGAGIGSFKTVYPPIEALGDVNPLYFNRMHNDYLEITVEAGLPGLIVVGLIVGLTATLLVRVAQSKVQLGTHGIAAVIVMLLVSLHAIVDYPLRTQAIALIFTLAFAFFFASDRKAEKEGVEARLPSWSDRSIRFRALGIGAQAIGLFGFVLFAQYQSVAAKPLGDGTTVLINSDEPPLNASQLASAKRLLARQPLDQSLLNNVYATEVRSGLGGAQRKQYVSVLGALGWRDSAAQQNLLFEAATRNDIDAAVDHMDALLRREKLGDQIMPLLAQLEVDPQGARIVAERLGRSPSWRGRYFDFQPPLAVPEILDARVKLLQIMEEQGDYVTRSELRVTLGALIQAQKRKEVADIARSRMPQSDRNQLLFDPNFDRLKSVPFEDQQRPLAYEWRAADSPGVSVQIAAEEWGSSLMVRWNGRGAPNLVRALTFLEQGSEPYMDVTLSDGSRSRVLDAVNFSLFCPFVGGVRMLPETAPAAPDADRRSYRFVAEGPIPCDYPDLMINGHPKVGDRGADLSIDAIELSLP